MKPIRFLPFLALCLGLNSTAFPSFNTMPEKPKERRKFRRTRDSVTKSIFGRRWSWGTPHLGASDCARLLRREKLDSHAAALNYPGWCGRDDAGSPRGSMGTNP